MSSNSHHLPTDRELLDYFILTELGGTGVDDALARTAESSPRTAACDLGNTGATRVATGHHPAVKNGFKRTRGANRFPRFFIGAALAGASLAAQAGSFDCVAGTFNDCALATSNLSWAWNGLDFTIANSGGGYVSEVYFDLGSGMTASFLQGTGTVNFYAGASPGSLPGGNSVGFVSDASFDSDPASAHNGLDAGETATFRILGATATSVTAGNLTAGLHVRSLTDAGASLVSIAAPVPEPETYAMMALGFGVVAWSARRKR
jgi:hypothetical protein